MIVRCARGKRLSETNWNAELGDNSQNDSYNEFSAVKLDAMDLNCMDFAFCLGAPAWK